MITNGNEQSLLFDLFKAFDYIYFSEKKFVPSCVRNMLWVTIWYKYLAEIWFLVRTPYNNIQFGIQSR